MTGLLARVRAADPAASLERLLSDEELAAWSDAGLQRVLSLPSPLPDVRPDAGLASDHEVLTDVLPRQRRPAAWVHRQRGRRGLGRSCARRGRRRRHRQAHLACCRTPTA